MQQVAEMQRDKFKGASDSVACEESFESAQGNTTQTSGRMGESFSWPLRLRQRCFHPRCTVHDAVQCHRPWTLFCLWRKLTPPEKLPPCCSGHVVPGNNQLLKDKYFFDIYRFIQDFHEYEQGHKHILVRGRLINCNFWKI